MQLQPIPPQRSADARLDNLSRLGSRDQPRSPAVEGKAKRRTPLTEKRALGVTEVSGSYGVCRATVYNLINGGKLPSSKVLGRRLIPREACEALFVDGAVSGPITSKVYAGPRKGTGANASGDLHIAHPAIGFNTLQTGSF